MCRLLSLIYGRDTRPVTSLNVVMAIIWLVMYWLTLDGTAVQLPNNHSEYFVVAVSAVVVVLAPMAVWCECRLRQVTKVFSLTLGALLHAVVANGYISKYPPLDMMMVVSVMFTLLFSGAVLYIFKCEGLDVPRSSNCR